GSETFGLAGSEDEQGSWKIALDYAEDEECKRFFGGDYAAGDNEGAAAVAGAFCFEPVGEWSGRGEFEVVFQVTADGYFLQRGTESANAVGVLLGLHEESRGVVEGGFEERL